MFNKDTNNAGKKFEPIKVLFNLWVKNLKECYMPSSNVTIDENCLHIDEDTHSSNTLPQNLENME